MDFSTKRIIFVTGKGGVGKSLVAASVAYRESKKGRRVCLVELGEQSFFESFFETRGIGYEPMEIMQNFHVSLFTPEESLREYITYYLKVKKLYDLFFENKVTRAFVNAAPGANELAILGKLTSDVRHVGPQSDYDLYVVDCFSTGHALALFRAPRGISEIVKVGPMGEQTREMHEILCSPSIVSYVVVTLAEEMPINEALELTHSLQTEFKADVTGVCNRLLFPPVTKQEIHQLKAKESKEHAGIGDFLNYLEFKMEKQEAAHSRLKEKIGALYSLPLLFPDKDTDFKSQDLMFAASEKLESPWALTNS